ncbi:type II toxin-antitoxin system RelE/ParE family toxin [Cnuella takakiae]|uniref:type II toxin-antitoxin system RelE/ParE family toxin n=1 Tax=Cnuella takakiae TaxID=1302690 RepID=UPI00093471BC|nr:killer suppression protein HigA [Cnuella takakiae]OLY94484.1 killer suppression protein HigA [Cnuella takakiae]
MNISYKTNKLEKLLDGPVAIKKNFGINAKRVAQRLDDIGSAPNLKVLCSIPQARCHPLSGNRDGKWAVDISANHRLIFIIDHDPIPLNDDGTINRILVTDIQIISAQEDYH